MFSFNFFSIINLSFWLCFLCFATISLVTLPLPNRWFSYKYSNGFLLWFIVSHLLLTRAFTFYCVCVGVCIGVCVLVYVYWCVCVGVSV